MQKHNKNKKYHRSHHVRISAVAIALATGFHLSGSTHLGGKIENHFLAIPNTHVFNHVMERENETGRHMVRFDAGLRLPSTSGGSAI